MKKGFTVIEGLIVAAIVILLVFITVGIGPCAGVTGCVDTNGRVMKAAQSNGFTDIKVDDCHFFFTSWRGCSKSDTFACDVSAKNVNGQPVDLLVCEGLIFKGSTIRTK